MASYAVRLVEASGVTVEPGRIAQAEQYVARRRRGAWVGIVCGLVIGFGPFAGDRGESLAVPRVFAGVLFGLLLSELLTPRPTRGALRAASLLPRTAPDLVPRWALALPWIFLLPLLATPLLAIGRHPHGVTRYADATGNCFATAYWPATATLFAIAGVAAIGLVLHGVTLRRIARRPQPAEDADGWQLDQSLRARSARSSVAAASALGLVLLAVVSGTVDQGIHSFVCTPSFAGFDKTSNVYSWASTAAPWLRYSPLTLVIVAILAWVVVSRLPVPSARPSAR